MTDKTMPYASPEKKLKIAILGASGYTGVDLIRLLSLHDKVEISGLSAHKFAGREICEIFSHLSHLQLPRVVSEDDLDYNEFDLVFSALPHGSSQHVISRLPLNVRVIDLSADFRLRSAKLYEKWYNTPHIASDLLDDAVYGLSEHCAAKLPKSRIVACPGCYPTAILLALLPVIEGDFLDNPEIIIDAKSGISGAGRSLGLSKLFCESYGGVTPYSLGGHRHISEIHEQLNAKSKTPIDISFTPHLVPMSRGELVTCYVKLKSSSCVEHVRQYLQKTYENSYFIRVLPENEIPATRNVMGSNFCDIGVFRDNIANRVIIIAAIDNLVKGSSGQAIQNMNIMYNFAENHALQQQPLFP